MKGLDLRSAAVALWNSHESAREAMGCHESAIHELDDLLLKSEYGDLFSFHLSANVVSKLREAREHLDDCRAAYERAYKIWEEARSIAWKEMTASMNTGRVSESKEFKDEQRQI